MRPPVYVWHEKYSHDVPPPPVFMLIMQIEDFFYLCTQHSYLNIAVRRRDEDVGSEWTHDDIHCRAFLPSGKKNYLQMYRIKFVWRRCENVCFFLNGEDTFCI